MSLQSNLQKRDTEYYFRVSVPISLRSVIGKSEIIKSLKTKDARQAKLRCQEVSLHILKWFDALCDDKYKQESHVMVHDTSPYIDQCKYADNPIVISPKDLELTFSPWKSGFDSIEAIDLQKRKNSNSVSFQEFRSKVIGLMKYE